MSPATLPEYLEGRTQKEKCPFHFRKIHPRENQKEQETFFFLGCRVKRGGGGALVKRTICFGDTTRSARATLSAILEIGSNLVQ